MATQPLSQSQGLQINFPVPAGVSVDISLPAAPKGQADSFMKQVAATGKPQALICYKQLNAQSLVQAQRQAEQLFKEMLGNTGLMMTYGQDSVAGMNALIDRMLHEVEPVDIPELTKVVKALNETMRGLKSKYNVSDPEIRKKLDRMMNAVGNAFFKVKTLLEMLMEDTLKIEDQLNRASSVLAGKEQILLRNISLRDQLYLANEEEIKSVIGVIAVMELIRNKAAIKASEIKADPANPQERDLAEDKRQLVEFANQLEIRISEFKNRLVVGWSTSPQITNMRGLEVALVQRLRLLRDLTIPVMKRTILQWRMLIQARQSAGLTEAVSDSANQWLQEYAKAGAEAVPYIANIVQTPSLTPETIFAMADAILKQGEALVSAYELGTKKRTEVDNAIVSAQKTIANTNVQVSNRVVAEILSHLESDEEKPGE